MSERRSSARLAGKRKRNEQEEKNSTAANMCHRPVPGQSAFKSDCGILPSEWYRIAASITPSVPWGYVCGFPTPKGDLFGGAHYLESASASLTPQGKAIKQAACMFGDGDTLCFTPCKKGYRPIINGEKMYACPLHHQQRKKRVMKEGGTFRSGEVDLNLFWDGKQQAARSNTLKEKPWLSWDMDWS